MVGLLQVIIAVVFKIFSYLLQLAAGGKIVMYERC